MVKLKGVYAHFLLDPGLLIVLVQDVLGAAPHSMVFNIPDVPGWRGVPAHFQALVQPPGVTPLYISTSASFVFK